MSTVPMESSIQTKNFFIGSAIFAAIALVVGLFLPFYVGAVTKDVSQKRSNQW